MLGTCATFSANVPLALTKKGCAHRDGAKVIKYDTMAVGREKNSENSRHFHAISEPNLHENIRVLKIFLTLYCRCTQMYEVLRGGVFEI